MRDADAQTLVRRLHFDLTGLPPSPQQIKEFSEAMSVDADGAVEALVDKLLDSQHFGQRWGRHWLDVVRYAESTGMERNGTFTRAWRYRDYVIDAFNRDVPFDQFIVQQIAGDLLPYENRQQRDRQLIATGMLALGPKSLNEPKKEKFKMDVVDEQIDVVSRAFLGLTASCARCHDHKFDPIPQSEYYALAGIFTSIETLYGTAKTNGNRNPGRLLAINGDAVKPATVSGGASGAKEEKKYRTQLKNFKRRLEGLKKQLAKAKNKKTRQTLQKRVAETQDDIRRATNRLKQATQPRSSPDKETMLVMAVSDAAKIADTRLRVRGEPDEYGREIPRGFLTIASTGDEAELTTEQSGRMELAHWITRDSNPLTARVAVNRIWQHLFGRGIVSTVNNFGANGDRPTHPELLDHLATTFVEEGWSTKKLIRRIVTSRTYRLASNDSASVMNHAMEIDPDNRLLWRMNQRRLEAEAIRDAMLLASGQLDLRSQTGSQVQRLGEGIIGRNIRTTSFDENSLVRSVYLPIVRGAVPEMLSLFDFPEPSIIGGARSVTTVPTQALFMMNSPSVLECASKLAQRLTALSDDPRQRVRQAYALTISREPSDEELDRAIQFVAETREMIREGKGHSEHEAESIAWAGFCQSLIASAEFRYLN